MLTLILPIHIETPADEAAVTRMLDSLEADSLSLCQCERLVLLSGTYSRELRGRLHKMASDFFGTQSKKESLLLVEVRRRAGNIPEPFIDLDIPCTVERGWLDRLVIEADRQGGVVTQGPATYYPKSQIST